MSLPGTAWMDDDGYHVWYRHDCLRPSGERHACDAMLPHPGWKTHDGAVSPSIVCMVPGCNFHSTPLIGKPPADWLSAPDTDKA